MRRLFLLLSATVLLAACGGRNQDTQSSEVFRPRKFPPAPSVPSYVSPGDEEMEYLLTHFWDAFTDTSKIYRCDTLYVNGVPKGEVEEAVGVFVTMLENCIPDIKRGQEIMEGMFRRAETFEAADTSTNVFECLAGYISKYLYDPNSPVRNEDLYRPYAAAMAASEFVPEGLRQAYFYEDRMCALNCVGAPAADFTFTDRNGRKRSLYSVKAAFTLLFFTNPLCPSCREITEEIMSDENVRDRIRSGNLSVVSVYIDRETDKWKELSSEYPEEWVCGYDQSYKIRRDMLYNIRAIPSLYLLDRDKKVIMKDAPIEKVLGFLPALDIIENN